MLEAMACGCAVVSTATCDIPNIIKHGENGLLSNDETELKHFIRELLADEDKAKELGYNARQTIKERFNTHRFVNEWNEVFNRVKKVIK
jgi:glycosyltransferase involved in cell wall biosynthesis